MNPELEKAWDEAIAWALAHRAESDEYEEKLAELAFAAGQKYVRMTEQEHKVIQQITKSLINKAVKAFADDVEKEWNMFIGYGGDASVYDHTRVKNIIKSLKKKHGVDKV